jgi:hypothetical protein
MVVGAVPVVTFVAHTCSTPDGLVDATLVHESAGPLELSVTDRGKGPVLVMPATKINRLPAAGVQVNERLADPAPPAL